MIVPPPSPNHAYHTPVYAAAFKAPGALQRGRTAKRVSALSLGVSACIIRMRRRAARAAATSAGLRLSTSPLRRILSINPWRFGRASYCHRTAS